MEDCLLGPGRGAGSASRPHRLRTFFRSLHLRRQPVRSGYMLQHRPQAEGKQGLLSVAQQIHDAVFGVAEKNAFAISEQVQVTAFSGQIGQAMPEVATEQGQHATNALQTEAPAAEVAEHS